MGKIRVIQGITMAAAALLIVGACGVPSPIGMENPAQSSQISVSQAALVTPLHGPFLAHECSSCGDSGGWCQACDGFGDTIKQGGNEHGTCGACMGTGTCQSCLDDD